MAFSFKPSTVSSSPSSPSSSLFGSASSQSSSSVFGFNFSSAAAAVDAPTPSSLFSGSIPSFILGTAAASTEAWTIPLFGSVASLPPFGTGPTVLSSTPSSSAQSLISNSASISATTVTTTTSPASETLALAASNSSSEAAATSSTVSASQSATLSSIAADESPIGSSIPLDFVIPYQLTKLPVFQGVLNDFKEELRCRTFKRLQELANHDNLTAETGFEIADSVELLKVLNASDPALETIGAKARDGATTLQEAALQLARGQASLRAASDEISAYLQ